MTHEPWQRQRVLIVFDNEFGREFTSNLSPMLIIADEFTLDETPRIGQTTPRILSGVVALCTVRRRRAVGRLIEIVTDPVHVLNAITSKRVYAVRRLRRETVLWPLVLVLRQAFKREKGTKRFGHSRPENGAPLVRDRSPIARRYVKCRKQTGNDCDPNRYHYASMKFGRNARKIILI